MNPPDNLVLSRVDFFLVKAQYLQLALSYGPITTQQNNLHEKIMPDWEVEQLNSMLLGHSSFLKR